MVCFFAVFILQYAILHFPNIITGSSYLLELQLALIIYSITLFYMAFDLLWAFSSINEFFEIHTLKLFNVKTILADLYKYKSHYFRKYLKSGTTTDSCSVMDQVLYLPSLSHVHSRLSLEISKMLGDKLDANIDHFFERSIQSVESIIGEIAVDQKYQNVTILGFVVTKSFIGNLVVLLGSVTFAFVQLVILGN